MSQWAGWKGEEGLFFANKKQQQERAIPSRTRKKPTKHKNTKVWGSDGTPVLYQLGDDAKWHRIDRPDDEVFDSRKEWRYYQTLLARQQSGMILGLRRQVPFELLPALKWNGKTLRARKCVMDFQYCENGHLVIEDVKSTQTEQIPLYRLKRHLFLSQHVIPFAPRVVFREVI